MSIASIVQKLGGGFKVAGKKQKLIITGGDIEYYTNPLDIIGGVLSDTDLTQATNVEVEVSKKSGGMREDNIAQVEISVSTKKKDDDSKDNKNIKPFKSYLYNILDNITI
jgi:hypothetical protein